MKGIVVSLVPYWFEDGEATYRLTVSYASPDGESPGRVLTQDFDRTKNPQLGDPLERALLELNGHMESYRLYYLHPPVAEEE